MLNEIFVYGLENFYFFMYFLPSATSVFVNPIVIILLVFPSSFSLTHFK